MVEYPSHVQAAIDQGVEEIRAALSELGVNTADPDAMFVVKATAKAMSKLDLTQQRTFLLCLEEM